jgi:hypothetical protein
MILKKRTVIKIVTAIPVLFLITLYIADSRREKQIIDKIKHLEKENEKLIDAKAGEGGDHPKEEQNKVELEKAKSEGIKQVKEPVHLDDKAPGTFKFF